MSDNYYVIKSKPEEFHGIHFIGDWNDTIKCAYIEALKKDHIELNEVNGNIKLRYITRGIAVIQENLLSGIYLTILDLRYKYFRSFLVD